MFKFWAITFAATGRTAIMRTRVIGPPEAALLADNGEFYRVGELPAFTSRPVDHMFGDSPVIAPPTHPNWT